MNGWICIIINKLLDNTAYFNVLPPTPTHPKQQKGHRRRFKDEIAKLANRKTGSSRPDIIAVSCASTHMPLASPHEYCEFGDDFQLGSAIKNSSPKLSPKRATIERNSPRSTMPEVSPHLRRDSSHRLDPMRTPSPNPAVSSFNFDDVPSTSRRVKLEPLYPWISCLGELDFAEANGDVVDHKHVSINAVSLLGRGVFGKVYRMKSRVDERLVALKVRSELARVIHWRYIVPSTLRS